MDIIGERANMSNVSLISNKIDAVGFSIMQISVENSQYFIISNVSFINNTGTGLKLEGLKVYFNNVTFYNNTGTYGGGILLYKTSIYITGALRFEKNTALLGGAIYCRSDNGGLLQNYIIINDTRCRTEQITFSSNYAGTGPDVFIDSGYRTNISCSSNINKVILGDHIISGPYISIINPESHSMITLFPGQKLTYSAHVTDYLGNLTSGFINIFLQCGNYYCNHVQLVGDAQSLLSTGNITTNLHFLSTYEYCHTYMNLQLRFSCDTSGQNAYAFVNLTACPLGYVFQVSETTRGTCECMDKASDDVQCDFVLGVACIRHRYWLGKINPDDGLDDTLYDIAPCQYPYCKTDLPPCPVKGLSQTYVKLPVAQDEQCNGLYGGLLCRSCREDARFSFEAVKCIPS